MAVKLFDNLNQNLLTPEQKQYYGDIAQYQLISANKSSTRLEIYRLAYVIKLTNGESKLYIF